jgi:hypothetical protein
MKLMKLRWVAAVALEAIFAFAQMALAAGPIPQGELGPSLCTDINNAMMGVVPVAPALGAATKMPDPMNAAAETSGSFNNWNVNGKPNIEAAAYAAFPSVQSVTCTANGTGSLTGCNSLADFQAGQLVEVRHGGPTSPLTTPSAPAVSPQTNGGSVLETASYSYQCSKVDANMGETAQSPTTTVTGYNTLDGSHWNALSCGADASAILYRWWKCVGAGCKSFSIAGFSQGNHFADFGKFGTNTLAPAARATRQHVFAKIVSASGSTIGLNVSISVSGTVIILHDAYTGAQAAINSSSSSRTWVPPGQFAIARPLKVTNSQMIEGVCTNQNLNVIGSQFFWDGDDGFPMLLVQDTTHSNTQCISLRGLVNGTTVGQEMAGIYVFGTNANVPLGGAQGSEIQHIYISGVHMGVIDGGEFCASITQPDCDTSALTVRQIIVDSRFDPNGSGIGLLITSSNAGDESTYAYFDCEGNFASCVDAAYTSGGVATFDHLGLGSGVATNAIVLESTGSQYRVVAEEDESAGGKSVLVPAGIAGLAEVELANSGFNGGVEIDGPARINSHDNEGSFAKLNNSTALVVSTNDNFLLGGWQILAGRLLRSSSRNKTSGGILVSDYDLSVFHGVTPSPGLEFHRQATPSIGAGATADVTFTFTQASPTTNVSTMCQIYSDASHSLTVMDVESPTTTTEEVYVKNTDGAAAHSAKLVCVRAADGP